MTTTASLPQAPAPLTTRVSELLGVDYPIVQAPMGWIAGAQLASAVSNAGGLGMFSPSGHPSLLDELDKMRGLTSKPFGINVAQAFMSDTAVIDLIIEQGIRFVTTSAGDPRKYTSTLKAAGLTVFHVVPTLAGALKAVDAGVDGLVVEGGEGGGFKNTRDVATMVLLPLVASKVDVPIIAAGGISDGVSMAAAFALGAEGVQMGTRMVSAAESPVHDNWKQAIIAAAETDTVFLNRFSGPGLRALRTEKSVALERSEHVGLDIFARATDLYFGGDMEAAIALTGQVCGRIESIEMVADIIHGTVNEFRRRIADLQRWL